MVVVGIDLAAQPKNTAICQIQWKGLRADVQDLRRDVNDDQLLELIASTDKAGIDVPLGWPVPFVDWLSAHQGQKKLPRSSRERLCFRATDLFVKNKLKEGGLKRNPLSVSSTPLAITAFRAAGLLANIEAVDRAGGGKICEVYPAAALDEWGLPSSGYKKKKGISKRAQLVAMIEKQTSPWLRMTSGQWDACRQDDNLLDALIAGLITRAAARDLVFPLPNELADLAAKEGWIALPVPGSLSKLAT